MLEKVAWHGRLPHGSRTTRKKRPNIADLSDSSVAATTPGIIRRLTGGPGQLEKKHWSVRTAVEGWRVCVCVGGGAVQVRAQVGKLTRRR